ncbi:MAG: Hsp33 family molecular chaperone HslO [Candidatus Eremiobacteraeota bacterium]|nr:Hsp33 family molecular chaperone HslO [Candidatus Eremiobacteraeota bacterium]
MPDLLLGATAAGASMFAAVTTDLVAEVQRRHDLSPTATAAVGRLVTGAALLGASLTGHERISLQISGDGPIATLVADAWLLDERTIAARGYARNGKVDLPIDARGKFDVSGSIGSGVLQVTKSYEVGQPYVGVVPLHSGEIAEDLAAYLAKSEQIASVVALGVLANPRGVVAAGGVMAQVLPGTTDASIARLEDRARAMPPVTQLVAERPEPLALLRLLSGDESLASTRSMDVRFACLCTKRKVEAALLGLGRAELEGMNRERPQTEATCEFCQRRYVFDRGEIAALIDRLEPA